MLPCDYLIADCFNFAGKSKVERKLDICKSNFWKSKKRKKLKFRYGNRAVDSNLEEKYYITFLVVKLIFYES